MNAEEMGRSLTRLKSVLTQWAPKEIDRDLCMIWLNVLKDFTDQQIRDAFLKAATDLTEWPAPATIKRLCLGCNKSDEEIGQDIASRIEGAIYKFGYTSPERAKEYIGDLGWHVVEQFGGWPRICEIETDQLPSSRKQWRELAAIVAKNFYTKGDNLPPSLPEKKNPILAAALRIALGSSEEEKPIAQAIRM